MESQYVIGVDFGSDSARALIIDARSGTEIAESVAGYSRWLAGKYQNASKKIFRQHPLDYLEALTKSVRGALDLAGDRVRQNIKAISVDTTGSTPCPVNREGVPLSLLPGFEEDPDAMFHLWKDHSAIAEAAEITNAFRNNDDGIDYTRYQGEYASEWFWAKILHTTRINPRIRKCAWSWVEHCDWIPAILVGNTIPEAMYRCSCAAGHKAYWHSRWGGLPSEACLGALDDALVQVRRTYKMVPRPSTSCLGFICADWAERLCLPRTVIIGGSSLDAHAGAVGAGVNDQRMVLNIGTSAVNMFVTTAEKLADADISYACGAAEDSIIPGMMGLEAGQAAFGDVYAWMKRLLMWPLENMLGNSRVVLEANQRENLIREISGEMLSGLQKQAEQLEPESVPVALDWFNGRRYPYVNETIGSAVSGINMGSDAPALYRSLIHATAMGQKRILECLAQSGICPNEIVAVGGIAQKSSLLMQILANVLGRRISVSNTKQACARGAAIFAAVAGGMYTSIEEAQKNICEGYGKCYWPQPELQDCYAQLYARYLQLAGFVDPA